MNTALKNKLLIMATSAGMAGFGMACSNSEAPAAEEGQSEETVGGESAYGEEGGAYGSDDAYGAESATETPAPAPAPAVEGETITEDPMPEAEIEGEESSCGEGSCS